MTPLNADEGIDLGTESKPHGSQRVFSRFTSIRELVRITDDLAADVQRLREVESRLVPRCARLEEQVVLLEQRVRALEGGR
jgi:hypothetical protein